MIGITKMIKIKEKKLHTEFALDALNYHYKSNSEQTYSIIINEPYEITS
ncbi:hypothetical protein [Aquimarina aggregata]|nr:hypothetical protein [Aquimarina aggregata]